MDILLYSDNLLAATRSFLRDLSTSAPHDRILSHFARHSQPSVLDCGAPTPHEPPLRLLDTEYKGRDAIAQHLRQLEVTMVLEKLEFGDSAWRVKEEDGEVEGTGEATFRAVESGLTWKETVTYRFKWVQEEQRLALVKWEIWAGASSFCGSTGATADGASVQIRRVPTRQESWGRRRRAEEGWLLELTCNAMGHFYMYHRLHALSSHSRPVVERVSNKSIEY